MRKLLLVIFIVIFLVAAGIYWNASKSSIQRTVSPLALSMSMNRPDVHQRPFSDLAPWNIPVANLNRHSDSKVYVERLWKDGSDRKGNFNLAFSGCTYPVYFTTNADAVYPVNIDWDSNLDEGVIPWHPGWQPSDCDDGNVIILDPENGKEWNLFEAEFDGETVSATNGNMIDGDYRSKADGFTSSRAIGIQYLAMLVQPEEIENGEIRHALSMAIGNTDPDMYVAPGSKIGHIISQRPKNGVPIGMRFALDISDEEIEAWIQTLDTTSEEYKQSARIIATALRDYGWFITDWSPVAKLQFEHRYSAEHLWRKLGLGEMEDRGMELPKDMLDGLLSKDRIYAIVSSDRY